jgi:type I restriction enzyme S subunit
MAREYKDSGIEWIGQIPKEWELATLKQIGKYINGYAFKPEDWTDSGKPIIRIQDLTGSMGSPNFYNGELDSKYLVSKGDILVSWAATLDAFIWEKEEGWLNQHIFKALPSCDVNYQFFYWLIKLAMENMNNDNKHGIVMQHVTTKVFGNFLVSIPGIDEQQKIADYLDKVCGEVDEMVALQETMIEELKAYKQSVITEAVTKGINPNVPMRNSGIDWIGEIPEHWGMQRLKTLGWTQNGISQSGDYFGEDYAYPFVSYSDAYKNYSLPYPSGRANSSEEDRLRYSLIEGDVLFTRTSETIEEIGFASTCIETIPNSVYSGFLIRFRPTSDKLFKGFSKYYFRSQVHRAYFVKQMNIVTRASLGQDLLKNLVVLLPPFAEQRSIASYLDEKCSEIDSLIAIKQAKIEELKEYKKSVIYEYVTGKKEVV